MSKFSAGAVALVLSLTLSIGAQAAPGRGGGGGHGGGGAPHGGGGHGGGMHVGGGGGFRGGAPRGGGRQFSARPSGTRSFARPSGGTRSYAGRSAPNHAFDRNAGVENARGPAGRGPENFRADNRLSGNNPEHQFAGRSRNGLLHEAAVRHALDSHEFNRSLHDARELHNPRDRARLTADAARAGWQGHEGGWWRHRNGGYGWVGPLFWPFAYYDVYDYALWGNGYDSSFWNYGYDDLYAGIFAPYGYDDLAGYLPQGPGSAALAGGAPASARSTTQASALSQMCGQDSRDIAGLPIDQFQQAIQPNDGQRAALDDLGNASVKAATDLKAACPSDIALTAPSRLAAMQQRIEAMIAAVQTVQPPLDKFYGLLNDEQKARLTALGQEARTASAAAPANADDQNCGAAQGGAMMWPSSEIDGTVKPTDAQRVKLTALQDSATTAGDLLKASCPTENPVTPPARLAAVGSRLDSMLQAVKTVRAPLDDFYASLSDEQKANFDAIGQQHVAAADAQPEQAQQPARRIRHGRVVSVERAVRSLLSVIR